MYRDAAEVSGVALDLVRMDARADLQTILQRAIADRTPHTARPVRRRKRDRRSKTATSV
jgi:hypothetical protein